MGLKYLATLTLFAVSCFAQDYQNFYLGGTIGYGLYRNGTIYAPAGTAQAGIRNRFAAGVVLGQDMYDYLSGEIRYLYQDGHPFLSYQGVRTDMQGQSHALTYDLLFHLKKRESRFRPFFEAGAGVKGYVVAGPAPYPQPIPNIATLNTTDEWHFAVALGGGVKYRIQKHVVLRLDFLDYLTTFPKEQIMPAPHGTARGVFEQFTPLFGVSYLLGDSR